jgi:hypothetical protein
MLPFWQHNYSNIIKQTLGQFIMAFEKQGFLSCSVGILQDQKQHLPG